MYEGNIVRTYVRRKVVLTRICTYRQELKLRNEAKENKVNIKIKINK